jgi:nucleoside 2-deoxyribosyltransferase
MNHYHGIAAQDDEGRYRGADGLSIENFDMADNLMLHGGILRRGGSLIVGDAKPDEIYTDLTAFKQCLKVAAEKLL